MHFVTMFLTFQIVSLSISMFVYSIFCPFKNLIIVPDLVESR